MVISYYPIRSVRQERLLDLLEDPDPGIYSRLPDTWAVLGVFGGSER